MSRKIVPTEDRRSIHVTLMMSPAEVDRLDALRAGRCRSEVIRQLLADAVAAEQGGAQ